MRYGHTMRYERLRKPPGQAAYRGPDGDGGSSRPLVSGSSRPSVAVTESLLPPTNLMQTPRERTTKESARHAHAMVN